MRLKPKLNHAVLIFTNSAEFVCSIKKTTRKTFSIEITFCFLKLLSSAQSSLVIINKNFRENKKKKVTK